MKKIQFDNEKIYFDLTMKKIQFAMKKNFIFFVQFEIGWAIVSSVLVQHGCSDALMGVESRLAAAG